MKKPKIVMLGICSQCGNIVVRPFPADTAVCECASTTSVPLVAYIRVSLKLTRQILENPAIPLIILPKWKRRKAEEFNEGKFEK